MTKLSTANLLSIHVLILRIFVFGGATRIVGAGSRQSQIGLSKGVLSANPLPGASGLGKLTKKTQRLPELFFLNILLSVTDVLLLLGKLVVVLLCGATSYLAFHGHIPEVANHFRHCDVT